MRAGVQTDRQTDGQAGVGIALLHINEYGRGKVGRSKMATNMVQSVAKDSRIYRIQDMFTRYVLPTRLAQRLATDWRYE